MATSKYAKWKKAEILEELIASKAAEKVAMDAAERYRVDADAAKESMFEQQHKALDLAMKMSAVQPVIGAAQAVCDAKTQNALAEGVQRLMTALYGYQIASSITLGQTVEVG